MSKIWFAATVLTVAASLGASCALAQDDKPVDVAGDLLKRMSKALVNTSYTATMFHHQGEHVNSLKAYQVNVDGALYQAIEHLDVASSQPIKYVGTAECSANSAFGNFKPENINHEFYGVAVAGDARVAGRMATRLFIKAKDALRYSYLVDVDNETALPLRYAIISQSKKLLERIQVVELTADADHAIASLRGFDEEPVHCEGVVSTQSGNWKISAPPGFSLVSNEIGEARERHTYSDGLTSFSVYIDNQSQTPTAANRGALNVKVAVRQLVDKRYTFTVMGDLPSVTIDRILATIRPAQAVSSGG